MPESMSKLVVNISQREVAEFRSLLNDQLASQHAHLALEAVLACFIWREFQHHLFTFGQ